MKSSFPGMDPYLEARWSDVHAMLIATIKEALQPRLPAGLRARSEERVLLEDLATPEPFVIEFQDGPAIDRFLQIIDVTNGNRVVTAIEILSPWNKAPGRLNDAYRRKVTDYAGASVNVVEIDL